jgi:PBP1b-binding outer membrane lipoprotein LpoB
LKKYFYVSILLGAFALSGCSDEKAGNKEFTEKSLATEQSTAPILLNLTQEQKENYYNQYLEVLEEISVEYPSANMELTPLDEYLDEHWIEPEELRERVIYFLENGVSYPI